MTVHLIVSRAAESWESEGACTPATSSPANSAEFVETRSHAHRDGDRFGWGHGNQPGDHRDANGSELCDAYHLQKVSFLYAAYARFQFMMVG
jgi:hypothetical protein